MIRGQRLQSTNRKAYLELELDGNLALYLNGVLVWSTKTTKGNELIMSDEGNVLLYDQNRQVLFSTEINHDITYLIIQDNGNLEFHDKNSKTLSTIWPIKSITDKKS